MNSPETTPEPNVIVKKSSYTEAQKRANQKWRAKNIEKTREYARKYAKKNYEKNKEILREKARLNYHRKKQRLIDEKAQELKMTNQI